MTKEELMALKLRQMMPYMQMHNMGQRVGPTVAPPALSPEEQAAARAAAKQQEIELLKRSM